LLTMVAIVKAQHKKTNSSNNSDSNNYNYYAIAFVIIIIIELICQSSEKSYIIGQDYSFKIAMN